MRYTNYGIGVYRDKQVIAGAVNEIAAENIAAELNRLDQALRVAVTALADVEKHHVEQNERHGRPEVRSRTLTMIRDAYENPEIRRVRGEVGHG